MHQIATSFNQPEECYLEVQLRTGQMAQRLKAPPVLSRVLSSIAVSHMVAQTPM